MDRAEDEVPERHPEGPVGSDRIVDEVVRAGGPPAYITGFQSHRESADLTDLAGTMAANGPVMRVAVRGLGESEFIAVSQEGPPVPARNSVGVPIPTRSHPS